MTSAPAMQHATLSSLPAVAHGRISRRAAVLDGVEVAEVTFHVGSRWSTDLRETAGTELCTHPHVALVTSGTLGVEMAGGERHEFAAGDVMMLPPGHDVWCVGDVDCTFVEFSQGSDRYAR